MADVTDTYYAGEAVTGYGAQLLVGQNDDPETFAAVADVNVITPGDMTTEVVDKTHLRSPEAHREKIVTIRDSGPFAVEGNWRPTHGSQSNAGGDGFPTGGLVALWRTRAQRNFKILVPIGEPSAAIALSGVVQTGGVATATSAAPHGIASGSMVTISGATPAAYNGTFAATVTSPTTFTYAVPGATASPATGSIAATATGALEWPFRGVVTKFQPGGLTLDDKTGFSAEITPLQDFSANLP